MQWMNSRKTRGQYFHVVPDKSSAEPPFTHSTPRSRLVVNMAARAPVATGRLMLGFRKWYYNMCGFNKLGLMRDDTIYEDSDVKEALRRLPENVCNDRMFRIKRALDLSMKQQILPKDQWTKFEEDVNYLTPYLEEVIRERKEMEEWMKK
ncbi:cytochrome b-c1 complex subunit 7 [Poeciliopsis prolifica]|uniref:cytochrome b-c1 complex subunit 7 n=1 Tax=Poeciliopsis prolifica TaxID=188132 RepID=UPI00241391D0|nr:cytochrome b-c1 complex subunit 7 [Poeciliopsis prolifica]